MTVKIIQECFRDYSLANHRGEYIEIVRDTRRTSVAKRIAMYDTIDKNIMLNKDFRFYLKTYRGLKSDDNGAKARRNATRE